MGDYLDMISLAGLAPEERLPAWRGILRRKSEGAKTFELHCWLAEPACIELALQYGEDTNANWPTGKIIAGPVTEDLIHMLTTQPKPEDTEPYDKMTPFFSIFFDNGFSSEHYGTELFVWVDEPEEDG